MAPSLTARLAAPEVTDRDLAESVLSSTYWGREDDLDIEYSIISQQNANLMLAHCLRRWLNINLTLAHLTSCVWWDVVGAVCDTSCEILGHQTCVVWCLVGVVHSGPALKQIWVKQKKSFLKVPTPIDGFNTDSARPRSTISGAASPVWGDEFYENGLKIGRVDLINEEQLSFWTILHRWTVQTILNSLRMTLMIFQRTCFAGLILNDFMRPAQWARCSKQWRKDALQKKMRVQNTRVSYIISPDKTVISV